MIAGGGNVGVHYILHLAVVEPFCDPSSICLDRGDPNPIGVNKMLLDTKEHAPLSLCYGHSRDIYYALTPF